MSEIFSIITINYNNLAGLRRTVNSVIGQTALNNVQYIVVDGASSDGSVEFLNEHKNKINKLISEKDHGIYDAMNKGLAMATGDYVWFVNSGDAIYSASTVEDLLPLVEKSPDVIFGDTMFIQPDGKELGLISRLKPQRLPAGLDGDSFRYGMSVCHQSFIVKRKLSPQYNLKYKQAADIDWIIRILKNQPLTEKYQGILSCFEIGGSSYQNEKKAWKERYKVLAEHYGSIPNIAAHLWIAIRRVLFNRGIWKP